MRSNLRPTAVRMGGVCGAPSPASARSLVSACTSSMNGLDPCTVTVGAADTSGDNTRSPRKSADGDATGFMPSSLIWKTPTSSVLPYRFLCPRRIRTARSASPSR